MLSSLARTSRFLAVHPLTKRNRTRAWARYVGWQIRSRLHDEVIVPWIGDQRLAIRRSMWGATGNVYAGLHDFSEMMLVLNFLRDGDLFVDVGANVGSYTVLASGVSGARSIAFEPAPETAALLRRNINLNHLEHLVVVREMAASESEGIVSFTAGHGPMNAVNSDGARQVRAVRLNDELRGERPAMIKIDAEGHDEAILNGSREVLACESLKIIIIEDIAPPIVSTLAKHDFAIAYYDPLRREFMDSRSDVAPNPIYLRDRSFVNSRIAGAKPINVFGSVIP